jgi:hypothetical protein
MIPLHPSEIIEFTHSGHFVRQYDVDAGQGGALASTRTSMGTRIATSPSSMT